MIITFHRHTCVTLLIQTVTSYHITKMAESLLELPKSRNQYVLKQRSVGSVVTQSPSDSTDDEDDDELGKNSFYKLL